MTVVGAAPWYATGLVGLRRVRPWPEVVGGVFEGGVYAPWAHDAKAAKSELSALERLMAIGDSVVSLADLVVPALAGLLGQLLSEPVSTDTVRGVS